MSWNWPRLPATVPHADLIGVLNTRLPLVNVEFKKLDALQTGDFVHNVKNPLYGAVGDGVTDDAAAIQRAIDAAELVSGAVFIPPGTYVISTTLVNDAPIQIYGPGVITQANGTDLATLVEVELPGPDTQDVQIHLTVNGNRDNNTAVLGVSLDGVRKLSGRVDITAIECDTGVAIEGNSERSTFRCMVHDCGVGVIERAKGGTTPDENSVEVYGSDCTTFYEKQSSGIQITSTVVVHTEGASSTPIVITGGDTRLGGILRGLTVGGVSIDTGDVDFLALRLYGADTANSVGLVVEDDTLITGQLYMRDFESAAWIKGGTHGGSLRLVAESLSGDTGLRIGDEANATRLDFFTLLPGSKIQLTNAGGWSIDVENAISCVFYLDRVGAGGACRFQDPAGGAAQLCALYLNASESDHLVTDSEGSNYVIYRGSVTDTMRGNIPSPGTGWMIEHASGDDAPNFYAGGAWRALPLINANGTATLANGATTVVVTHGLGVTPDIQDISVTPIEAWGTATQFWINTPTSTQFTINVDTDPGQDVDFAWTASVQ
jgi:hypothetical protein